MEFGFNSSSPSGGGGLIYMGAWDALTNSPLLQSGVGNNGEYYIVNVAGSTNLDGITDWEIGDWAVFNGSAWQKIDNSSIGGSGTTNYVSKFTGSATLGNSQIIDDGTNVGIGGAITNAKVQVTGGVVSNGTAQTIGMTGTGAADNNNYNWAITPANDTSWGFRVSNSVSGKYYVDLLANVQSAFSNNRAIRLLAKDGASETIMLTCISGGNVGIGLDLPAAKLHVQGIDSTASNFALKVDNSASASLLSVRNDGFITINGNTLGAGKLEINGGSYQGVIAYSSNIAINGVASGVGAIGVVAQNQSGAGTSLYIRSYDVSNKLIDIVNSSTNPISRMLDSGYFGIGTISPTAMVHSKGIDATSSNFALKIDNSTPTTLFSVRNDGYTELNGDFSIVDKNIIFGTTTGTKIGTSTTQKLAFYNATPIIQPSAVTSPQGIANALSSLGLLASSTIDSITLTTIGTSGPATYTQATNTLNIPEYNPGGATDQVNFGSTQWSTTAPSTILPSGATANGFGFFTDLGSKSLSGTTSYDEYFISAGRTLTLTGTSGTANINILGVNYLATFATDLTTTANNFVTAYQSTLLALGIQVFANTGVLKFGRVSDPSGGSAVLTAITITTLTGNLSGTFSVTSNDHVVIPYSGRPYFGERLNHFIRVNFNIDTGSNNEYSLTLRRWQNDTQIGSEIIVTRSTTLTGQQEVFVSFTAGATDPFVTGGFYFALRNPSANNVTISGAAGILIETFYQKPTNF